MADLAVGKRAPRTPNSALDLSVRPVTPVAKAQLARQSVPQVSASVRRLEFW